MNIELSTKLSINYSTCYTSFLIAYNGKYKWRCLLQIEGLLIKNNIDMKLEFKITDEQGNEHLYNVVRSSSDEPKNLNDFILEALSISEDKRQLPLLTQCPNELEVFPSLKMKFENYGSPLLGDKLEAMMVTWRD